MGHGKGAALSVARTRGGGEQGGCGAFFTPNTAQRTLGEDRAGHERANEGIGA